LEGEISNSPNALQNITKATPKGVVFSFGGGQLALIEQSIQPISKN